MKLADLQLAMGLQAQLAALDEWPAGDAVLSIGGVAPVILSADELAGFVEWRRSGIKTELRRLGVDIGDGPPVFHTAEIVDTFERNIRRNAAKPREQQPQAALTRDEAFAAAREIFLADHSSMLARGLIDQAEFDRVAGQREGRIRDYAEQLLHRPPPAQCEDCNDMATTVVDGRDLCDTHAASRPRLVRPSFGEHAA